MNYINFKDKQRPVCVCGTGVAYGYKHVKFEYKSTVTGKPAFKVW